MHGGVYVIVVASSISSLEHMYKVYAHMELSVMLATLEMQGSRLHGGSQGACLCRLCTF